MSRFQDAQSAWPALEAGLKTNFNIAVYSRGVYDNGYALPGAWGAAPASGEVAIRLGVDISSNDPKAAQLPVTVDHGNSKGIPVTYHTARQPSH